jgi:hypothetical protein
MKIKIKLGATKPSGGRPRLIQQKGSFIPISGAVVNCMLGASWADHNVREEFVEEVADWVVAHPELAGLLRPEGQFHRRVLNRVLGDPRFTPELSAKLAAFLHLLPYLI